MINKVVVNIILSTKVLSLSKTLNLVYVLRLLSREYRTQHVYGTGFDSA